MKSTKKWKITDLGKQELDVYDLEIKDNHNFYGNNILLHNSLFINLSKVLKDRYKEEYDEISLEDKRNFCILFYRKALSPIIEKYYENYTKALNFPKNTYSMDFEVISDRNLMVGKKRYIMNLVYDEGDLYESDNGKLKIKGVEIIRTNTPLLIRNKLKELVRLMINTNSNDECIKFIKKFKKEFFSLPFEKIARPTGVKGLDIYQLGEKSVPIHVRASKIYNNALIDLNLKTLQPINNGEKIKYCYINEPNIFNSNVIACIDFLPDEIRNKIEIDYNEQFNKTFLSAVEMLFEPLGWKTEKSVSLDSLF